MRFEIPLLIFVSDSAFFSANITGINNDEDELNVDVINYDEESFNIAKSPSNTQSRELIRELARTGNVDVFNSFNKSNILFEQGIDWIEENSKNCSNNSSFTIKSEKLEYFSKEDENTHSSLDVNHFSKSSRKLKNCCVMLKSIEKHKMPLKSLKNDIKSEEPPEVNDRVIQNKLVRIDKECKINLNRIEIQTKCICDTIKFGQNLQSRGLTKCFSLYNVRCGHCDFRTPQPGDPQMFEHIRTMHPACDVFCRANTKFCSKFMEKLMKLRRYKMPPDGYVYCPNCPSCCSKGSSFKRHLNSCCKRFICVWCSFSSNSITSIRLHCTKH